MTLDKQVRDLIASQTFEPHELHDVLVKKGHAEATVAAAIEKAVADLEDERNSPAHKKRLAKRKGAGRLVTSGVMVLVIGTAWCFYMGWGWLPLLLVIAIGGGLISAGYRSAR